MKSRGAKAPHVCLQSICNTLKMPYSEGLGREFELFMDLVVSGVIFYACFVKIQLSFKLTSSFKIRNQSFIMLAMLRRSCNDWRGSSPRFSPWTTQLQKIVAAVARRWRQYVRFYRSGKLTSEWFYRKR